MARIFGLEGEEVVQGGKGESAARGGERGGAQEGKTRVGCPPPMSGCPHGSLTWAKNPQPSSLNYAKIPPRNLLKTFLTNLLSKTPLSKLKTGYYRIYHLTKILCKLHPPKHEHSPNSKSFTHPKLYTLSTWLR